MAEEMIPGGMFVCRPLPIECEYGDEVGLRLMSDLHVGASQVDYKLIEREISEAKENGDRVLINGDLLDLILPKDHKRFSPTNLHPRISGRSDVINAAVMWAAELLAPVATQLDMLGIGNHEEVVTRYHGIDPTLLVIYELEKIIREKKSDHQIHYGGYTGFVDYRIRHLRKRKDPGGEARGGGRWVLYYHHGSGAAAPVTKGMIDFNRKDTFVDASAIWMGHKHNNWNGKVEKLSCPMSGDQPTVKEVRHIMTGAYFSTYQGQTQASVRTHGRRSNYAADMGMAPQGKGGVRLILKLDREHAIQVKAVA